MRRSLVATLEGLWGVIPAALPVSLRQPYQDDLPLHWGPMTLTTAVVTVPVPVTLETVWADTFKHWLLMRPARAESALSPQRYENKRQWRCVSAAQSPSGGPADRVGSFGGESA